MKVNNPQPSKSELADRGDKILADAKAYQREHPGITYREACRIVKKRNGGAGAIDAIVESTKRRLAD